MSDKVYAEELPYFQTSKVGMETWMDKAEEEIKKAGGTITASGAVQQLTQAAVFIAFELQGETYRVTFPVLESKRGNQKAAKIQAATMLYHDVKARSVAVRVLGAKVAFGGYRVLPDGRTDGQVSTPELVAILPKMLISG